MFFLLSRTEIGKNQVYIHRLDILNRCLYISYLCFISIICKFFRAWMREQPPPLVRTAPQTVKLTVSIEQQLNFFCIIVYIFFDRTDVVTFLWKFVWSFLQSYICPSVRLSVRLCPSARALVRTLFWKTSFLNFSYG